MSHFLEARELTVHYGNVNALRGVSFHVDQGEIVTLIGSNGAGKTSSLMAISNLIQGTRRGTVEFGGEDITHLAPSKIVKLGISHVPEGRHIFPKLTVEENLLMGTFGAKRYDKAKAAATLEEIYQMFPRLRERRTQLGGTLSGGEQQMLAIGRALMNDPRLLLLDEPSLGLAPNLVQIIFELIQSINRQGVTILLIEQNANMALAISDRAYVLETGRIRMSGDAKELARDPRVKKAYLGLG